MVRRRRRRRLDDERLVWHGRGGEGRGARRVDDLGGRQACIRNVVVAEAEEEPEEEAGAHAGQHEQGVVQSYRRLHGVDCTVCKRVFLPGVWRRSIVEFKKRPSPESEVEHRDVYHRQRMLSCIKLKSKKSGGMKRRENK